MEEPPLSDPGWLPQLALHEAGHAVVAYRKRLCIARVKVAPDDLCRTETTTRTAMPSNNRLSSYTAFWRPTLMMLAGGMIAEELFSPDWSSVLPTRKHFRVWCSDYIELFLQLYSCYTRAQRRFGTDTYLDFIADCCEGARRLLLQPANARAVDGLAKVLLERGEQSGAEVEAVIRSCARSRRPVQFNQTAPTRQQRLSTLDEAKQRIDQLMARSAASPDADLTVDSDDSGDPFTVTLPAAYLGYNRPDWKDMVASMG